MTVVEFAPPARARTLDKNSIIEIHANAATHVAFRWGRYDVFGTAAYWIDQAARGPQHWTTTLSRSILEEVCFCLLGGYGITAEVNIAAFEAVASADLLRIRPSPSADEVEVILRRPLDGPGRVRPVGYRFPHQRAVRLALALAWLETAALPDDPIKLRDALLGIAGVGPKTASWIVRNVTGTDDVAIIDVHVRRAGIAAGFFSSEWRLPRDYRLFESSFLQYAAAGAVRAAVLDLCIWEQVRRLGRAADTILKPAPPMKYNGTDASARGGWDGRQRRLRFDVEATAI